MAYYLMILSDLVYELLYIIQRNYMKITKIINDKVCTMEIEEEIVGIHALDLDQIVRSISFDSLGVNEMIFNLTKTKMIDSIFLDVIKYVQEQGLKVTILNPTEIVNELLEMAIFNKHISSLINVIQKEEVSLELKAVPIAI
jgi:anti-anti-sigma regulatory factor